MTEAGMAEYVVRNEVAGAETQWVLLYARADGRGRGPEPCESGPRRPARSAAGGESRGHVPPREMPNTAPEAAANRSSGPGEYGEKDKMVGRTERHVADDPECGPKHSFHSWQIPGYGGGLHEPRTEAFPPDRAACARPMEWSRPYRRPIKRVAKKKTPARLPPLPTPPTMPELAHRPPPTSLAGRFAWRPPHTEGEGERS
ncbi:hypothetical protein OH77DRAFT_98064 [Trametes cingulata]|nr:hypothetical protein OH77DRAFT_98064 [Trametes cingulata]